MDEHHHHHHYHPHNSGKPQVLLFALLITLSYSAIEAGVGLWSGSLALLGDAGHMLTDSLALGLAALASHLSRRPPSTRHTYGLGRIEVIAALLNALLMLGVVISIGWEAFSRLQQPQPVHGTAVMVTALIGLLLNGAVAWLLSHGEDTLNTRAALLHVMGDLLGSVAAVVAGIVIFITGWTPIDPLLALLICGLILHSTFGILRESLHVMLEGVPLHLDLPSIGQAMAATSMVRSVHDLHIWSLGAGRIALSAHIMLDELEDWPMAQHALEHLLHEQFGIDHVTLQPEVAEAHVLRPMPYPDR